MTPPRLSVLLASTLFTVAGFAQTNNSRETFDVWPGGIRADDTRELGAEHVLEGRPRPFYQITDVAHPTVTVFEPTAATKNGTAILVCPGGGLQRLAVEHEGFEVSAWLRDQGFTVFMLKYRVPGRVTLGLQDAQRTMRLIRGQASKWDIDPEAIGIIGFSAGAEIAAWLSTHYEESHYAPIDNFDRVSSRPDFTTLIYAGGLLQRNPFGVKQELADAIDDQTPPTFIAQAFDDSVQNSLHYALALKARRIPTEMHLFQEGGHGFGVRPTGHPVNQWTDLYLGWLETHGWRDTIAVRAYEREFAAALPQSGALPQFSAKVPNGGLPAAYDVQRRLVRRQLESDEIAGFKGGVISIAAQAGRNIDAPLTGVLFKSGEIDASESAPRISVSPSRGTVVETEIGFRIAVDIGYRVLTPAQARDAVAEILPVIELPDSYRSRLDTAAAVDLAAINLGSNRFLTGKAVDPASLDPDALVVTLSRNGESVQQGRGNEARDSQWANLQSIINQIVDRGQTLRAGSIIISGALGPVELAQPGHHVADYGDLGRIEFDVTVAE